MSFRITLSLVKVLISFAFQVFYKLLTVEKILCEWNKSLTTEFQSSRLEPKF